MNRYGGVCSDANVLPVLLASNQKHLGNTLNPPVKRLATACVRLSLLVFYHPWFELGEFDWWGGGDLG